MLTGLRGLCLAADEKQPQMREPFRQVIDDDKYGRKGLLIDCARLRADELDD